MYTILSIFLVICHICFKALFLCKSFQLETISGTILKYRYYSTRNDNKIKILNFVTKIYYIMYVSRPMSITFKVSYLYQFSH